MHSSESVLLAAQLSIWTFLDHTAVLESGFEMASSQFSFADDRSDLSSILPKIYVQYVDVQSVVWSGYSTHGIGWNRPLSCH